MNQSLDVTLITAELQDRQIVTVKSVQRHPDLTHIFNF